MVRSAGSAVGSERSEPDKYQEGIFGLLVQPGLVAALKEKGMVTMWGYLTIPAASLAAESS